MPDPAKWAIAVAYATVERMSGGRRLLYSVTGVSGSSVLGVTNSNTGPSVLEQRYRAAALDLAGLPDDDELEPDFHPWEPGGRYWRAAKCALIALRRKHSRLGDEAMSEDERFALNQFVAYQAGDKRAFETQTLLNSARYVALKELLHEHGLSL